MVCLIEADLTKRWNKQMHGQRKHFPLEQFNHHEESFVETSEIAYKNEL